MFFEFAHYLKPHFSDLVFIVSHSHEKNSPKNGQSRERMGCRWIRDDRNVRRRLKIFRLFCRIAMKEIVTNEFSGVGVSIGPFNSLRTKATQKMGWPLAGQRFRDADARCWHHNESSSDANPKPRSINISDRGLHARKPLTPRKGRRTQDIRKS
jgi:hypothetical protein